MNFFNLKLSYSCQILIFVVVIFANTSIFASLYQTCFNIYFHTFYYLLDFELIGLATFYSIDNRNPLLHLEPILLFFCDHEAIAISVSRGSHKKAVEGSKVTQHCTRNSQLSATPALQNPKHSSLRCPHSRLDIIFGCMMAFLSFASHRPCLTGFLLPSLSLLVTSIEALFPFVCTFQLSVFANFSQGHSLVLPQVDSYDSSVPVHLQRF